MDNLPRLNENEEADRQGVFDLLGTSILPSGPTTGYLTYKKIPGIFESMIGINPQLSTHLVSKTTILPWLLKRMEVKPHDGNRGYAAEIIPILVDNRENKLALGKTDGIETLLKVLSVSDAHLRILLGCFGAEVPCLQQFRRRNPSDADETEFMENVFDALCAALT